MDRRSFLKTAAYSLAAGKTSKVLAWAVPPKDRVINNSQDGLQSEGGNYSFIVLGDIHYDLPGHHDMTWLSAEMPQCVKEVEGYCRITKDKLPKLIKVLQDPILTDKSIAFIVQAGDLVEGLCGSYELASMQFKDAISYFDNAFGQTPFFAVKGNHEVTGPGSSKAYDDVMIKWISRQTGQNLSSGSYTVKHGPDLFIFFDYYKDNNDIDWIEHSINESKFRHLFFVVHQPIVPESGLSMHIFYSGKDRASQRKRLLNLLGKHHAIVISAHIHSFSMVQRVTDTGSFTQVNSFSLMDDHFTVPNFFLDSTADYGPNLTDYRPDYKSNIELRKSVLEAEKPFIRKFYHSNIASYNKIRVSGDKVEMEVYLGAGKNAWKVFDLKPEIRVKPQAAKHFA